MTQAVVQAAQCLVDDEGCAAHVAHSLSLGHRLVTKQPRKPGRLAIVASGPSVADHLDELRAWDGPVWAINGAFCWLHDQGRTPDAFVALDPGKGMEAILPERPDAIYYLAAICDPDLFAHVQDRDVRVWCSIHNNIEYPKEAALVTGGTTCLTRVPFLAHVEGFRDITIFGGDCSFRVEAGAYCYEADRYNSEGPSRVNYVRVGGQVFATNEQMIRQASFFGGLQETMAETGSFFGAQLTFRADGLLKAWLDQPIAILKNMEAA